jgi:hypothetical protein
MLDPFEFLDIEEILFELGRVIAGASLAGLAI